MEFTIAGRSGVCAKISLLVCWEFGDYECVQQGEVYLEVGRVGLLIGSTGKFLRGSAPRNGGILFSAGDECTIGDF